MATLSDESRSDHSYERSLTGATSGDGAQEIPTLKAPSDAGSRRPCRHWQVQLSVTGGPTAGTLTVRGRTPGASEFVDMGGSLDMTGADTMLFEGVFEAIEVEPDSFDGTDYSVHFTASTN